jgi:hypothetical protein
MATERALPEFVMVTDAKNCQVTISTNRPKDALAIAKFLERAALRQASNTDSVNSGLALTEGEQGVALQQMASHLSAMLGSAIALVDGVGNVVGYQIKTGALHRVLGCMAGLSHPVVVPLCRTKLVLNHESSPWPLEGNPRDSLVATASQHEKTPASVSSTAPREGPAGGALERQKRLVATLPQTVEQARRLIPCAAITGNDQTTVVCGHCGKAVTPGGACAYTSDAAMQASNGLGAPGGER